MQDDSPDTSVLQDFLIDAEVLLTKTQECLLHLELIGNDPDAIDCMVDTLGSLANRALTHDQPEIADFCLQLRLLLEPERDRNRLHGEALDVLSDCLTLLSWQLELIDPQTGLLSLDNQEQLELIGNLTTTLGPEKASRAE
ncbi:hypothetical protein GCM10009504_11810 [Pseudomonas laurentiana]|uniref:Histidine kinase n=1 Tax=Pseudomonas laurentiana TaxID=2364649 RepID=A0A6I5RVJ3_9PSED|nr:histidine kinase [Pseudomonas laurentiana]NES11670.1 histidine kinase [Pseudomonas laurentiana]GGU56547.1 hypothetical protein GCM10009504_11810 [Pseudomonas laurentiana]